MALGSRRVLTPLAAVLLLGAAAVQADEPRLLLTVGDVTATAAVVWARGVAEGELAVEATAADGAPSARGSVRVTRGDDFAGKVRLTGLRPATRYVVRVKAGAKTVSGEFLTAPAPDQPARVVFLWSGDLGGDGRCRLADGGYRIFRAMTAHRPDFFLFVGDTIYADFKCNRPGVLPGADFVATTLNGFRARHRYNREDPAVQDFFRTTSVYAIWDDHEVRNDFSGPTEPLMVTGRRAFLEYWPVSPPDEEPTRLYRKFRWGR
ncbi:MAG: alkaline phosphatase D family protein, partial [Candidatus Rokubacteria bacterium]|nr:alkaline phosphatase D family protein [Candidatus Rokubacteria bacterium]